MVSMHLVETITIIHMAQHPILEVMLQELTLPLQEVVLPVEDPTAHLHEAHQDLLVESHLEAVV